MTIPESRQMTDDRLNSLNPSLVDEGPSVPQDSPLSVSGDRLHPCDRCGAMTDNPPHRTFINCDNCAQSIFPAADRPVENGELREAIGRLTVWQDYLNREPEVEATRPVYKIGQLVEDVSLALAEISRLRAERITAEFAQEILGALEGEEGVFGLKRAPEILSLLRRISEEGNPE